MEVEETSETDDFQLIPGNRKRKKSPEITGAVVEEGKVEQNVLNNNKFSPLAENNVSTAGGGDAPAVPPPVQSAGKQKQPPLVVKSSTAFYRLVKITSLGQYDFEPIFKITRFGTKVLCRRLRQVASALQET
uniref:(northern house mosquito) hypothetical protein n=1 Tax=Culex pipiens TaxID=7175 RepID=A0A8D8FCK2_CULPI